MALPEHGLNQRGLSPVEEAKEKRRLRVEARIDQAIDIERILQKGTITIKAGCQRAFDYPAINERQVPLTERQIRNLNRTLDHL